MTKKLKRLEKETAQWKQRWEKSNTTLLEMATEKKQRDTDLISASKQISQLEKLCRALQAERTVLLNQIKGTAAPSSDKSPVKEQDESPNLSSSTSNDTDLSSACSTSAESNSKPEESKNDNEKLPDDASGAEEPPAPGVQPSLGQATDALDQEQLIKDSSKMTLEDASEPAEPIKSALNEPEKMEN